MKQHDKQTGSIMLDRIIEVIGSEHGEVKKLGSFLGLSPNTISDWKAGRVKSYTKYAPRIAEYYGVSLDWLSGNSDTKKDAASISADDTKLRKFEEIINQLSPEGIEDVLWYALQRAERERTK